MCLTRGANRHNSLQGDSRVPAGRHRKTPSRTLRLRRLRGPAGFALALATAIPITASAQVTTADEFMVASPRQADLEAARSDVRASRSSERLELPARPVVRAPAKVQLRPRWTTTRLNVWTRPSEDSRLLTVLDIAVKVGATGKTRGPWAEIRHGDRTAWVRKAYLASKKPPKRRAAAAAPAGVSGAPCPDGSSVESGLQRNTVKLYRAVCAAFPAVNAWGGRSGSGGNHGAGRALDIMCSGSLGTSIANYVRSHASELGVSEVIYARRIWTVQRSSEGWRPMEDRGSSTANHYDHVHVSLY